MKPIQAFITFAITFGLWALALLILGAFYETPKIVLQFGCIGNFIVPVLVVGIFAQKEETPEE